MLFRSVFLPCDFKYYVGHCYLKCVPGKAEEAKTFVKKILEENLPPSIQLHISTLLEDIHQAQAIENNMKGIILFFSFVSLIITLLGVDVYKRQDIDHEVEAKLILNQKAMQLFGLGSTINARLEPQQPLWPRRDLSPYQIIGIVEDFYCGHLSQPVLPIAFTFNCRPYSTRMRSPMVAFMLSMTNTLPS